MSMAPDESGPSMARRFVAHALTLFGLEEDEPDVALVVSELVANACRYARGEVTVRVEVAGADALRIEIEDDGPGMPALHPPDSMDAEGRGLQIVTAIARRWGTDTTNGGKTVWVELFHHGTQRIAAL